MTTLTVQAEDTATAMEKIVDQLGPDALILSTTKRDGKIIMRASNESAMPADKKAEAVDDNIKTGPSDSELAAMGTTTVDDDDTPF